LRKQFVGVGDDALLSDKSCACNNRRDRRGSSGGDALHSRLRGLRQRRLLPPSHMFLKCDGRIGSRRSVVVRYRSCCAMSTRRCELRRGSTSNTRSSTQDLQQSMG